MWTLATPFTNKPYAIPIWLECLKKLDIDRSEFKLVWIDIAGNPQITALLKGYIAEYGHLYKEVVYIDNPLKKEVIVTHYPKWRDPLFDPKLKSVAETMNMVNAHREGNLLLWEDDIIVPSNAWKRLKEVFDSNDNYWGVTGVQYTRDPEREGNVIAWNIVPKMSTNKTHYWRNGKQTVSLAGLLKAILKNIRNKRPIYHQISYKGIPITKDFMTRVLKRRLGLLKINDENKKIPYARYINIGVIEKEEGIETIGASGTGFFLFKGEFLDHHTFKSYSTWGQDIVAGFYINGYDKRLDGGPNKVVMVWDMKFLHLGEDDHGNLKVFKSLMCKTKI